MTCDWCLDEVMGTVVLRFEDGREQSLDLCGQHLDMLWRTSNPRKGESPGQRPGPPRLPVGGGP